MTEAVILARRFPNAKLVFTGGSAALVGDHLTEGDVADELFRGLGIAQDRLLIERRSRTTMENAAFTQALLEPRPEDHWILVTSASHMPRSVEAFEKAGFSVIPYPVDFSIQGNNSDYWSFTLSPTASLMIIDRAMKEWIGIIAYRLHG